MPYTVSQLAELSGITPRTLRHYDKIDLLNPSRGDNEYRLYDENDLLRLQQILFFKELDLPLDEIKRIIDSPSFEVEKALKEHRKLVAIKRKRLDGLLRTIDDTISKIENNNNMPDENLYAGFSKEEQEEFAREAKQRWGGTDAYNQSVERVSKMTPEDMDRIKKESHELTLALVATMPEGPLSDKAQELIAKHYDALRNFYEPSIEMYRRLASMYVEDPRFKAFYGKYAEGLAEFMRDAMTAFCNNASNQKRG